LGMDVYGYDPYISVNAAWTLKARIHHITQLKTIFEECDYITLHLPLLDSTRGMLNEEAFAQMKDGVRIVNFARDGLIEQDALISAIENGKVAAFVTDFADEKLLHLEQVIITPHLGASTPESEDNCARMAVEETREYLETGNIRNSVNMPALSLEPSAQNRICIINRNVPNMVAKISSQLGQYGINIETMANKARGEYAYTIVETNDTIDELSIEGIRSSEGIINVRVIQQTA
ncbi:MAG: phosphoglycerate dehydrogenase, partial [Merdibacter sp.]|nr:phosphoglycerate dehydrogenase [Merdibacter sp.]